MGPGQVKIATTPGSRSGRFLSIIFAGAAGALPLAATAVTGTAADTMASQERLADAGRNPLTGSYGMIFRLYGAASGGTPRCAPSPGFGRSWSGRLQRLTSSSRGG